MRTATENRQSAVLLKRKTSPSCGGKLASWSMTAHCVPFQSVTLGVLYVTKPTSPRIAKPMTSSSHANHGSLILYCQHKTNLFCKREYIHCVSKNSQKLYRILTDFQNFGTVGKRMKFATKKQYPSHLRYVTTLPWEIKKSIFCRYSAYMEKMLTNFEIFGV